jgi:hypothetical protein
MPKKRPLTHCLLKTFIKLLNISGTLFLGNIMKNGMTCYEILRKVGLKKYAF